MCIRHLFIDFLRRWKKRFEISYYNIIIIIIIIIIIVFGSWLDFCQNVTSKSTRYLLVKRRSQAFFSRIFYIVKLTLLLQVHFSIIYLNFFFRPSNVDISRISFYSKINFISSIFLHIKVKILNKYKIYIFFFLSLVLLPRLPAVTPVWERLTWYVNIVGSEKKIQIDYSKVNLKQ